ncbi:MAG: hypothetical protein ACYDHX_13530 [Methanothrix sp.]
MYRTETYPPGVRASWHTQLDRTPASVCAAKQHPCRPPERQASGQNAEALGYSNTAVLLIA